MEFFFLENLKKIKSVGKINDDCEILEKNLVIASDSFIENIHFKLKWLSLKNITKKAFLVNISDFVAKNAVPKYAILSIVISNKLSKKDIKEIVYGIQEICSKFKIKIVGGDTVKGSELAFHITLIGHINKKYITRQGIKKGNLVAYTSSLNQNLGSVLKELKTLLYFNKKLNNKKSRFLSPVLRTKFMNRAYKFISSSIDISDGLYAEIKRLESLNNLNFKPNNRHILESKKNKLLCISGEEYEILFTFSKKHQKALERIAQICRIKINIIGSFNRFKKLKLSSLNWH